MEQLRTSKGTNMANAAAYSTLGVHLLAQSGHRLNDRYVQHRCYIFGNSLRKSLNKNKSMTFRQP